MDVNDECQRWEWDAAPPAGLIPGAGPSGTGPADAELRSVAEWMADFYQSLAETLWVSDDWAVERRTVGGYRRCVTVQDLRTGRHLVLDEAGTSSISSVDVSGSRGRLAIARDIGDGSKRCRTDLLDLDGHRLDDGLIGTYSYGAWALDERSFFYSRTNGSGRPCSVWFHRLGDNQRNDIEVFRTRDEARSVALSASADRRAIFIFSRARNSGWEIRVLDSQRESTEVLIPRSASMSARCERLSSDRYLVFHTQRNGPRCISVMSPGDDAASAVRLWTDNADVTQDVSLHRWGVTRLARRGLASRVHRLLLAGDRLLTDQVEGFPAYARVDLLGNRALRGVSSLIRVSHAGLRPVEGEAFAFQTRASRESFVPMVKNSRSRDGVEVPITLSASETTGRHAHRSPAFVSCYGAYGRLADVSYSPLREYLVRQGVLCVTAHVRGGGDLGPKWAAAGRSQRRLNAVWDLIDGVRFLQRSGLADLRSVTAFCRSAGALTVGMAMNLEPTLFSAVVAEAPYVDLLAEQERSRRGLSSEVDGLEFWSPSPSGDGNLEWLRSISPVENVQGSGYPQVLAVVGQHDGRVAQSGATAWIRALRRNGSTGSSVLVRRGIGHGELMPVRERAEYEAFLGVWVRAAAYGGLRSRGLI